MKKSAQTALETSPDIAQHLVRLNNSVNAIVFINLFIFVPIAIYFLIESLC